jgi:hypothetical protein
MCLALARRNTTGRAFGCKEGSSGYRLLEIMPAMIPSCLFALFLLFVFLIALLASFAPKKKRLIWQWKSFNDSGV